MVDNALKKGKIVKISLFGIRYAGEIRNNKYFIEIIENIKLKNGKTFVIL